MTLYLNHIPAIIVNSVPPRDVLPRGRDELLCYAILYYTLLYSTIQYNTTQHNTTQHKTTLYYTILHYTTLHYTILYYTTPYYYYTVVGYITIWQLLDVLHGEYGAAAALQEPGEHSAHDAAA